MGATASGVWSAQVASRAPRSDAVVTASATWSSDDLGRAASAMATWLDGLGVAPGAPVAALLWSSADALALILAGAATGRPIAPLGPLLTPAELAACLDGLGSEVLLVEDATGPRGAEVAASTGHRLVAVPAGRPSSADHPVAREVPSADDVAVILHTSGTSGVPNRVPIRQRHLAARTAIVAELLQLGVGDRYVTAKPIHHIGGLGLTLAALGAGAAVIPFGRFTVDGWHELATARPTHASVVPSMVEALVADGRLALPGLRLLQYGGAPMHPDTAASVLRDHRQLDLVALYGQTEGSPLAALTTDDHRRALDRPELLKTAGRAAPGVELVIEGAGADGEGEVAARAAHLMLPDEDGWLRTGDLGRIDGDGYLHLVGRRGDVINRGGENVHPREVEEVLAAHPAVLEVAVSAIDDRRLGQAVAAWVVHRPGVPGPTDAELHAWTRARLAGFKVPQAWVHVDALPRNAAGKVVRRLLPMPS